MLLKRKTNALIYLSVALTLFRLNLKSFNLCRIYIELINTVVGVQH